MQKFIPPSSLISLISARKSWQQPRVRYGVSNRAKRFQPSRREQSHPRAFLAIHLPAPPLPPTTFNPPSPSPFLSSRLYLFLPPASPSFHFAPLRRRSGFSTPHPLLAARRDWRYQSHPRSRPLETPCCHFITSCTIVAK